MTKYSELSQSSISAFLAAYFLLELHYKLFHAQCQGIAICKTELANSTIFHEIYDLVIIPLVFWSTFWHSGQSLTGPAHFCMQILVKPQF